jgi:hypothetical protein
MRLIIISFISSIALFLGVATYTHIVGRFEYDTIRMDSSFRAPQDTIASADTWSEAYKGGVNYTKGLDGHWHKSANDGLSNESGITKLGQSVGASGNPATITENREIPFSSFLYSIKFLTSSTSYTQLSPDGILAVAPGVSMKAFSNAITVINSQGKVQIAGGGVLSSDALGNEVNCISQGFIALNVFSNNVGLLEIWPSHTPGTNPPPIVLHNTFTLGPTVIDGAIERNASHLYYTSGSTRYQLDQQLFAASSTKSGDGTTTSFTITHGLSGITATTPAIVTPRSAAAAGSYYVTTSSTTITITYAAAPISGTNNLTWSYELKP